MRKYGQELSLGLATASADITLVALGRPDKPDDLIMAAIYLASPASDFITGQTLFVDGGWVAKG